MPFRSESQRRLFHAMAGRGEISKSKVKEWEDKTKNKEDLPYKVKHRKGQEKKSEFLADYCNGVKLALANGGAASPWSQLTNPQQSWEAPFQRWAALPEAERIQAYQGASPKEQMAFEQNIRTIPKMRRKQMLGKMAAERSIAYDVGVKLALAEVGFLKQAGSRWGYLAAASIPLAALTGLALGGRHNMNEAVEKLQRLKLYGTLGGGVLGAGAGALIGKHYDQPGIGALLGSGVGASLGRQVTPHVLWNVGE